MYKRSSFKVFQYNFNIDGIDYFVERTFMINYKKTISSYKVKGNVLKIQYLGSYIWNE